MPVHFIPFIHSCFLFSQVAALRNSPEFRLGLRKNAKMNTGIQEFFDHMSSRTGKPAVSKLFRHLYLSAHAHTLGTTLDNEIVPTYILFGSTAIAPGF